MITFDLALASEWSTVATPPPCLHIVFGPLFHAFSRAGHFIFLQARKKVSFGANGAVLRLLSRLFRSLTTTREQRWISRIETNTYSLSAAFNILSSLLSSVSVLLTTATYTHKFSGLAGADEDLSLTAAAMISARSTVRILAALLVSARVEAFTLNAPLAAGSRRGGFSGANRAVEHLAAAPAPARPGTSAAHSLWTGAGGRARSVALGMGAEMATEVTVAELQDREFQVRVDTSCQSFWVGCTLVLKKFALV